MYDWLENKQAVNLAIESVIWNSMIQACRCKMFIAWMLWCTVTFSNCYKCFLDHWESGALLQSPVPEQERSISFSCIWRWTSLKFSFYCRNHISKCPPPRQEHLHLFYWQWIGKGYYLSNQNKYVECKCLKLSKKSQHWFAHQVKEAKPSEKLGVLTCLQSIMSKTEIKSSSPEWHHWIGISIVFHPLLTILLWQYQFDLLELWLSIGREIHWCERQEYRASMQLKTVT